MDKLPKKISKFTIRQMNNGFAVVAVLDNGKENKIGIYSSRNQAEKTLLNIKSFLNFE